MADSNVTIFDNINGEIRRRNITQEALCDDLGINRRRYASWQAKGDMPISFFMKCAKYFNCTLDYLTRDVQVNANQSDTEVS